MPLVQGNSRAAISQNIATEMRGGTPPKQAQAIAFSVARRAGGKVGVKGRGVKPAVRR